MSRPKLPEGVAQQRVAERRRLRSEINEYVPPKFLRRVAMQQPTEQQWRDRDQRANAPRDANMMLLGDPVVPRWQSNG